MYISERKLEECTPLTELMLQQGRVGRAQWEVLPQVDGWMDIPLSEQYHQVTMNDTS